MKVAVLSLISVLCVQVLYAASIPASSKLSEENGYLSVYSSESRTELYQKRIGLVSCAHAAKQLASVVYKGWQLFSHHRSIVKKAKNEKKICAELAVPEETDECLKKVAKVEEVEMSAYLAEFFEMGPALAELGYEVIKCVL